MKKIRQRRERGLARYLCVLFGGKLRDWASDAGRSLNFGRKKLNIIHVNSVMFFLLDSQVYRFDSKSNTDQGLRR
jgi:hypothetical protein